MTPLGPGKMKRYKKRTRCFVVNLDWTMGNGKPVRAYLQPNDIVVLEVSSKAQACPPAVRNAHSCVVGVARAPSLFWRQVRRAASLVVFFMPAEIANSWLAILPSSCTVPLLCFPR